MKYNTRKERQKLAQNKHVSNSILPDIEATLAELVTYLEANPDDGIAQVQYRQFIDKRNQLKPTWVDKYEDIPNSEMLA